MFTLKPPSHRVKHSGGSLRMGDSFFFFFLQLGQINILKILRTYVIRIENLFIKTNNKNNSEALRVSESAKLVATSQTYYS